MQSPDSSHGSRGVHSNKARNHPQTAELTRLTKDRFVNKVRFLRRQFFQDRDLPFSNVLSDEVVAEPLTAISACWMDRVSQVLVVAQK